MDFQVRVTPEVSEAIQKIAFRNKYRWMSGKNKIQHTDKECLTFRKKLIAWWREAVDDLDVLSVQEAIEELMPPNKVIIDDFVFPIITDEDGKWISITEPVWLSKSDLKTLMEAL